MDQTPKRKAPRSAFKKGQSGNPGGRPKVLAEVRSLARQYTTQAVNALVAALQFENQCVAAAKVLLAYGYGNPPQALEVTGKDGTPLVSSPRPVDQEIIHSIIAARVAALAPQNTNGGNGNGSAGGNGTGVH